MRIYISENGRLIHWYTDLTAPGIDLDYIVRMELVPFDPFQNARPCWLSPLRQIALIEAARELNNRKVG